MSLRSRRRFTSAAILAALFIPCAAQAHSFGRMYNLPVPLWMYLYGAAAALLLSFLVVGYFVTVSAATASRPPRDISDGIAARLFRRMLPWLQGLSLLCLLLCLATGFFGSRDPYRNFSMTFVWVVFLLGFSYLCAAAGDLYALLNPWRLIARGIGRVFPGYERGRLAYPPALAYWPALGFYMALIWLELFFHVRPFSLALLLLIYSGINLAGVWLFGSAAWFRYCEFLAVFLRLVARMAPLDYRPATRPGERGRLLLRAPFTGLLQERAEHWSLLLFILFMLSSTAYDGLHVTRPWYMLFWGDSTGLLREWLGQSPIYLFVQLRPWYLAYETLCLLLSPFLYLAVYLFFIALAKALTRSPHSMKHLALAFAFSLLPIVLVYNITHYYTLILTQGVKIFSLLSDPFGWGWNLFGTAGRFRAPFLPEMGLVWHTQVGLILFGHIVSVYLAHVEALRLFPGRGKAVLSQLPMLVLMMLFTVAGLWILVQPISPG
ncbi:hypothetical protein D0B54_12290 [Solimonas sp. K1W22B-7]|uniref:hypothetical protein n=1 Tax=Solimonas sp. K1W22B-7 TaxID=2303331 RepID=UPI000E333962|nr:hypothetical protein [Solimonas sp. K1W22B-7]AXQ29417.1 hypothetical protein D0B54_12290 [Solimonas sp. K1W22B-7]